jgi:hypothetical protein
MDEISTKINKILASIKKIEFFIEKIKNKIAEINAIYIGFEFNKNLAFTKTNSYLKFQVELLNNEKAYYTKVKKTIVSKLSAELYEISEYIILILISMENLDINRSDEIKQIMAKIIKIKKKEKYNSSQLVEMVTSTNHNIQLVNDFINLFDAYINSLELISKRKNFHCNTLKLSLQNKKNHINVEYNKYCDQLKETLNYFVGCSDAISFQIDNNKLLSFFISQENI